MIQEYIRAAMRHAKYEIIEDDGSFYGHIEECPGLWANEKTLEACREELESALEDWLLIGIAYHDEIPEIDGISLKVELEEHA
ncbi:MAG: type II toxin-antitoxin system HicB family antitoxin [Candidatus Kapaibacterium sp.]